MSYFTINVKLLVPLTVVFIIMTVIGTLSHEFGHYSVAKALGQEAHINYQSSWHTNAALNAYLGRIYEANKYEIQHHLPFAERTNYEAALASYQRQSILILMGGPLQTMLTGTTGFLLLVYYRKRFITDEQITWKGWVCIFLALFWLRQLANLATGLFGFIVAGKTSFRGDEFILAQWANWNMWSIQVVTALVAVFIFWKVLSFIPKQFVLTFILSGLMGGVIGYYAWLIKFGKYILP